MTVRDADGTGSGPSPRGRSRPTLKTGIALALLDAAVADGAEVTVDVRARREPFLVIRRPSSPRTSGEHRRRAGGRLDPRPVRAPPAAAGRARRRRLRADPWRFDRAVLPGRGHVAGLGVRQGGRLEGQTYEQRLATRRSAQPVVVGVGVLVAGFGAALLVTDLRRRPSTAAGVRGRRRRLTCRPARPRAVVAGARRGRPAGRRPPATPPPATRRHRRPPPRSGSGSGRSG